MPSHSILLKETTALSEDCFEIKGVFGGQNPGFSHQNFALVSCFRSALDVSLEPINKIRIATACDPN